MYRFNISETFPAPGKAVLKRSMVDFRDYEKFMPNVSRIQVLSRDIDGHGREHIAIQVYADAKLPSMARAFMGKDDLNWKEQYVVDHDKLTADWQVETPVFPEYVDCKGTSWIEENSAGSRMVITGTMTIDHKGWTGLGGSLARKMVEIFEPFIGKMVTKNLRTYFHNIKKEIEKENRAGAK